MKYLMIFVFVISLSAEKTTVTDFVIYSYGGIMVANAYEDMVEFDHLILTSVIVSTWIYYAQLTYKYNRPGNFNMNMKKYTANILISSISTYLQANYLKRNRLSVFIKNDRIGLSLTL